MDFWDFTWRIFDLAKRKGEVAFAKPLGRFDVPAWYWDETLVKAGQSSTYTDGIVFGFHARRDDGLDPDALRYVTAAS